MDTARGRPPSRFERYVAIGDSSTEGLDDRAPGGGYRGWSLRLAERIARAQGSLMYANLAIRGRRTRQIRDEQLAPALAMRPDLATLFTGTNDVVARGFDAAAVGADIAAMQRALVGAGATVLTFTLPDLTPVMPLARSIAPRVRALNDAIRGAAAGTGAIVVDFAAYAVATDDRLWSADRIHANSAGHERIAAALAQALGLPGTDDAWKQPLPARAHRGGAAWLAAELAWGARHLVPWAWMVVLGRGEGAGLEPRRPTLEPVTIDA